MMLNKLKRRIIMIFLIICIVISGNIYPMDIKASESIAEKSDIYRHDIKIKTNDETDNVANKSENNVIVGVPRPIILYSSGQYEQKYKAIKKIWNLIQCVAPDNSMGYNYDDELTAEQKNELSGVAENITSEFKTDYEKAKALYTYVADNIYYDYVYYNDRTQELYINPYDIYKYKRTVCAGYARLYATLCGLVNIHTMDLIGEDHEYNAVYCKEEGRWIFVDSTWGSRNSYYIDEQQNVVWNKGSVSDAYFDSSIEFISNLTNHEVLRVSNISYENAVYNFSSGFDDWINMSDWENMDRWHLEIVKSLNDMQKEIYGIPVTVIGEGVCTDTEIEVLDLSSYTNIEKIGYHSFANLEKLKKIILPNSILQIGGECFQGCNALKNINIQDCAKLSKIEWSTFSGCKSIENIELPEAIVEIDNSSFADCEALKDINIQKCTKLNKIGYCAFSGCNSIKKMVLPDSVVQIYDSAFENCEGLEEIDIKNCGKLSEIEEFTFYGCKSLKKVKLPDSVIEVCECAFSECEELESINLQDCSNLKQIKDSSFWGCEKLEELKLLSSITDIGKYSFTNCISIKKLELPDAIETIEDYAFANCWGLNQVKFGKNLKNIGNYSFEWCGELTKIDLSNTAISSIGENAFYYDTSVGEIRLPASLKSIGKYAFSEIPLLKVLYLPMDSVDIGTGAFDLVSSTSEYKTSVVVTDMTEDKLQGLKCDLRSFVIGKYAYTINYDGNGESSGTMDFDIAAGGADYRLKECVYQKDNDLFIGWNTKKDGTGLQYDDMANVNSLVGDGESITLYAQWSRSGDLDGDSKVTTKDLMILLYGVSGRNQLTGVQQKSADIDRDGKVTVSDLTRLLYYVSGRNSYL